MSDDRFVDKDGRLVPQGEEEDWFEIQKFYKARLVEVYEEFAEAIFANCTSPIDVFVEPIKCGSEPSYVYSREKHFEEMKALKERIKNAAFKQTCGFAHPPNIGMVDLCKIIEEA